MYEKLKQQYNKLSEEEKNLLLLYKSKLGYFINNIDLIYESKDLLMEFENEYQKYKEIVLLEENAFFKMTIFKDINFDNLESFIKSVRNIRNEIEDLKEKIFIDEDLKVYRATTVKTREDIENISKSNLISTTLDLDVTDDFYTYDGIDVLYQISLKKNTSCLIIPFSIKIKYINDKPILKLIKDDSQQEIVLFKDSINYNIIDEKYIDEENLFVIKIDTEPVKINKLE